MPKINVSYMGCTHMINQDLEEFLSTKPAKDADFMRQFLPVGAKEERYKQEAGPCPACFKKGEAAAKEKAEADADEAAAKEKSDAEAKAKADTDEATKVKASEADTVA